MKTYRLNFEIGKKEDSLNINGREYVRTEENPKYVNKSTRFLLESTLRIAVGCVNNSEEIRDASIEIKIK